jgi:hypothetical protein
MTALVHMTDDDLKALGIPMVNPMKLGPTCIVSCCIFFSNILRVILG